MLNIIANCLPEIQPTVSYIAKSCLRSFGRKQSVIDLQKIKGKRHCSEKCSKMVSLRFKNSPCVRGTSKYWYPQLAFEENCFFVFIFCTYYLMSEPPPFPLTPPAPLKKKSKFEPFCFFTKEQVSKLKTEQSNEKRKKMLRRAH